MREAVDHAVAPLSSLGSTRHVRERTPSPRSVVEPSDGVEDRLGRLRQLRAVAPREDEVEQRLAVERLLEAELGGLDGLEQAARVDRRVDVPGATVSFPMISESSATHASRSSREFQTSARTAAGPEHARDLGQRDRVVEPVERLRAGDDVGGAVGERHRLRVPA